MNKDCIPSKSIKRNKHGLIEDLDGGYIFNEEGMIDWRKMVKPEYLVPNRDRTSETDVTKIEDKDLLILLGGIKELAQIRGYTNVTYGVVSPSSDYVIATCTITWIPNYETEGRDVTFSAIGDASHSNTKSFAKHFLGPIAENRAFVRCVRSFLKINIVSQEEMGVQKAPTESSADPKVLLGDLMKEKSMDFNAIKSKLIKEDYPNAQTLLSIKDIPNVKIFELLERIKKIKN